MLGITNTVVYEWKVMTIKFKVERNEINTNSIYHGSNKTMENINNSWKKNLNLKSRNGEHKSCITKVNSQIQINNSTNNKQKHISNRWRM